MVKCNKSKETRSFSNKDQKLVHEYFPSSNSEGEKENVSTDSVFTYALVFFRNTLSIYFRPNCCRRLYKNTILFEEEGQESII